MDGTAERGVRSEMPRLGFSRTGELDRMPVLDVGMFGVGYRRWGAEPTFWRFAGRGRPGEDEGSKGGSREGAGRFSGESDVDEAEVDEVDDVDDVVVVNGAGSATSAAAGFRVGESMAAAAVNVA
jgi:hypothetical protein